MYIPNFLQSGRWMRVRYLKTRKWDKWDRFDLCPLCLSNGVSPSRAWQEDLFFRQAAFVAVFY